MKSKLVQPRISSGANQKSLQAFKDAGATIIDTYEHQLAELCMIEQPTLIRVSPDDRAAAIKAFIEARAKRTPLARQGSWAFLPWRNTLIHLLPEQEFHRVRTSRNNDLISREEQEAFYNLTIGIAGLSVGSSIALGIALSGGGRTMKLADFDTLELSNTNRVLAGVHELGLPKTTIIAQRIWEINPYAKLALFPHGLTKENVTQFVEGAPKLDLIIDEMDQMPLKQRLRELARANRLPFLSAADNGDASVVDIERHDLRKTPFFHGRLGRTSVETFEQMDKLRTIQSIAKLMGIADTPERMFDSVPRIGTSLVSVPQLGATAMMGAAAVVYCARRIAAKLPLAENRAVLSLDRHLVPKYDTASAIRSRAKKAKAFAKKLGL